MPLRLVRRPDSSLWWITGTVAGSRVRESTGTDRRDLAEEARAARETALMRQNIFGAPARRCTFGEAAVSYLTHAGPHSDATRFRVGRLLKHFGPRLACDDVDQARLDLACAQMLRANPSPATRLREIVTPVRAVIQHAAKRSLCAARPFDTGKIPPARTEWLTPAEADKLIAASADHLKPLLTFLGATGARLGEALALDWRDVDLQHARALLRGVREDGSRGTKSGRDRIVHLCPRVLAALAPAGGEAKGQGRVFRTARAQPYADKRLQGGGQIKTAWRTALAASGIARAVTPHSLRHTWASWHYAVHHDVLLLKSTGGWASVALVERYTHLTPPGMAPAIKAWRGETHKERAMARS